jgi:hypothetical protein
VGGEYKKNKTTDLKANDKRRNIQYIIKLLLLQVVIHHRKAIVRLDYFLYFYSRKKIGEDQKNIETL